MKSGGGGRIALLGIFFLSGASGLVYQVVWSRSLMLVFGSTTHAVSTVLAAFMGGLALGSILVGRRGDRLRSPLRLYAWMELAIGGLAVGVLLVLPSIVPLYRLIWSLAGGSPAWMAAGRFLLSFLLLLLPTTLMGATLPILSAHLERPCYGSSRREHVTGTGAGALYSANTVGAVVGTAAAGFVLLPGLGMLRSALVAAAANLLAAVAAFRLARREGAAGMTEKPAGGPEPQPARPARGSRYLGLLLVFGLSGAGALVLEVVWTRILSLVLGSSTEAFTIMLATFLAGLAMGSACATRLLGRLRDPVMAFALAEMAAGLAALGGVYLFPELPYAFVELFRVAGDDALLFRLGRFVIAAAVMLPPTVLLGAAFPLAARAALKDHPGVSDRVAALYTSNTVGAIAGSCLAGFLLVPTAGLQGSLLAGSLAILAAGAALLALSPSAPLVARVSLAGAVLVLMPGVVLGVPSWRTTVMGSGVYQYAPRYQAQFKTRSEFLEYHQALRQLYYEDGPTTTVAVEQHPRLIDGQVNLVLSVNGKADASSVGDLETQVLLGQLPMLVAPRAERVLLIGMGSGISAGSALTHPLKELSVVEIEPAILEAQELFRPVNGRPLEDPRTVVRVDDARNELLVSDKTYDLIISEPSNPWLAGPSKLFTLEFFELARRRLEPSGLLCQWVQLYGMDAGSLKTLLRTYAEVFPHRMVFTGSPADLLVLGSSEPIRLDLARIAARMARPAVSRDLARIEIEAPEDLLARFRLGTRGLETFASGGEDGRSASRGRLNTDDNSLVEFAATRTLYEDRAAAHEAEIGDVADTLYPDLEISDPARAPRVISALTDHLMRSGLGHRARALVESALEAGGLADSGRAELLAWRGLLVQEESPDLALGAWNEALSLDPGQPRAVLHLSRKLRSDGRISRAIQELRKAPEDPACRLELCEILRESGRNEEALEAVAAGPAGGGGRLEPRLSLCRGRALLALGETGEAARELRRYFDVNPELPRSAEMSIEAAAALERASAALGRDDEARDQRRLIAGLSRSLAEWNRKEAGQAIRDGEPARAIAHLRQVLRWAPEDLGTRSRLVTLLETLGRLDEAQEVRNSPDGTPAAGPDASARKGQGL